MYFKVKLLDRFNLKRSYHAYVSAFDKKEARQMVRYELLDDEKGDVIDVVEEITKEEFVEGYKNFGDGVRE